MPYTRYGEINKGEKPFYEQPVINFYQGHFQVGLGGEQLQGRTGVSDLHRLM